MRLDKFLADMGVGSRSDLKKAIRKSLVTVNGAVEKDPGAQVSAEDHICFNGAEIRYAEKQYYMLHKPAGVLSASEDRRQTTVVDLIRDAASTDASAANASTADHHAAGGYADGRIARSTKDARVRKDLFPVGRLDKDTEGLLIITNDGPLAHQLLVPKHHIDKTYYAIVTGTITEDDQRAFTRGIRYDEKLTALPATLRVLSTGKTVAELRRALGFTATSERLLRTRLAGPAFIGAEDPADITDDTLVSEVEITIQEGKFHQIKKMVKALPGGKEILYLRRITMGALRLDPALAPGEFRKLSEDEIRILKKETE
ncbi:MAG: pseudouridine synthase [Oribacterium sp.]|nr:pseudouridine synthase [Oribacterium sp.]